MQQHFSCRLAEPRWPDRATEPSLHVRADAGRARCLAPNARVAAVADTRRTTSLRRSATPFGTRQV